METRGDDPGRVLAAAGATIPILTVFGFLMFEPKEIALLGPIVLIIGATGAVCWFRGPRWRYLAGVVGLLLLLLVVGDVAALLLVESALDMVMSWSALLGGALLLLSAATAVREFAIPARVISGGAAGLLVVIAVVSGAVTLNGRNTLSAAELDGAVVIRASGAAFEPGEVSLSATGTLRLALINDDAYRHTFTSETLLPGRERIVEIDLPSGAGEVHFFCKPHSSGSGDEREGMVGVIRVE